MAMLRIIPLVVVLSLVEIFAKAGNLQYICNGEC